ncbi:MerR family transcriptional regulator [Nocardia sp. X0981]
MYLTLSPCQLVERRHHVEYRRIRQARTDIGTDAAALHLLGLLVPDRVDPVSGYRYYEVGQLARLNRIIALKELGFTLDQVRRMLDGTDLPVLSLIHRSACRGSRDSPMAPGDTPIEATGRGRLMNIPWIQDEHR